MSENGSAAAIMTGNESFGGDWRIVIIENPSSLADWLQIPASFPSIRDLQRRLNESGMPAGFPDGILGPQTRTAVSSYWQKASAGGADTRDAELEAAIFSSFPNYLLNRIEKKAD